jgi:nucleoside-diphosphate kinase
MERTLVLIKPDGVKRQLIGRILQRFEDAGMKIVAMKLRHVTEAHALGHYTEDLARRRGEIVRKRMVDFLQTGPVLAFVLEGVSVIENVRKIVGATEPKAAPPGTIRGDFSHVSFAHADAQGKGVENLIHASADAADAEREVWLWFNEDEFSEYRTVHEAHTL